MIAGNPRAPAAQSRQFSLHSRCAGALRQCAGTCFADRGHSACGQSARRPVFPSVCRLERTRCLRLRDARPCPPRLVTSFDSGDSASATVFSGRWPGDAMRQHGQELPYACASRTAETDGCCRSGLAAQWPLSARPVVYRFYGRSSAVPSNRPFTGHRVDGGHLAPRRVPASGCARRRPTGTHDPKQNLDPPSATARLCVCFRRTGSFTLRIQRPARPQENGVRTNALLDRAAGLGCPRTGGADK